MHLTLAIKARNKTAKNAQNLHFYFQTDSQIFEEVKLNTYDILIFINF